jgi:F-box and leucine-rich repeat protein 2/20
MADSSHQPDIEAITPVAEHPEVIQAEAPAKLKGRQRLLQSLQRISSSPSLTQLGRRRATSNPYGGRGTFSTTSLASGSNTYAASGFATAPTSVPGTPAPEGLSNNGIPSRLTVRRIGGGYGTPGSSSPATAAFPTDSRPGSSRAGLPLRKHSDIPEMSEDYFSKPANSAKTPRNPDFDFWRHMPHEIRLSIFSFLKPKELVKASVVSKDFYRICYDGQLWTCFDASEFYTDIPAESLAKIIVAAGPFVKNLNLRGCVQVEHYKRAEIVVKACKNLINATLEGCRNFQRQTLHTLLSSNERLAHLNLTGLVAVSNATCKIIARSCPQLELFNVSWCTHMDVRGIRMVLDGCKRLRDLRAGEVRGFNSLEVAQAIYETNNLERLILSGCSDLDDTALQTMIHGIDPEVDILTDRPTTPVRKLRHLDLTRCNRLTSQGVKALAYKVPYLEGLQLSGCTALADAALEDLLATTPHLTHLDLEELAELTNSILSEHLAKAPCASRLEHLSISYCENLGDTGMLPVIRECTKLKSIDMDNTRISDLVLAEAAAMVRARSSRTTGAAPLRISLRMVVFDCQNVTWTGIREVLSRNAEIKKPSVRAAEQGQLATYPTEVIGMKCFYGWQMTVDEHMKRVLKGDLASAGRLERRWADYMMMNEEAGVPGAGVRRRRRRAREAAMLHADEEEGGVGMGGIGRRRRARSGGCTVM